ncbi:hypothetical protein [Spirosoma gilvum]
MTRFISLLLLNLPLAVAAQSSEAFWTTPATRNQPDNYQQLKTAGELPSFGLENRASLSQMGNQNLTGISQTGYAQLANLQLSGTANQMMLEQSGYNNTADLQLTGHSNQFRIRQDGGDNAQIQAADLRNTRLELVQGSGNNTFISNNPAGLKDPLIGGVSGLRIEQTGGASVTIQTGHIIGR